MKKLSLFVSALAISVLILSSFALAAPSKVIPLQGKLTQPNGLVYNGQYSMTFKIYSVATSGTPLYTETISNVPVSAGLFSIILGESTPLNLPFDQDYYIEISIGSETLAPRQRLLSSPYAIYSSNSSYATSATNVIGGSVSANNVGIVRNNDALSIQALDNSANYGGIIFYNNTGGRTGGIRSHTSIIQSGSEKDLELWSESGDVYVSRGNVGIGRTPTQKLDIAGNIAFDGGILSGANSANFLTYTGSAALPIKTGGVTISDTYTDNAPANGLFVKGNVGIGTQTPLYSLDVNGTSRFSQQLRAESGALVQGGALWVSPPNVIYTNTINAADSSGLKIADNTNSGGLFIKGNSGNVGIGTTNPSEKLDVVGNVKATGVCIGSDCRTSWPTAPTGDVQFNSINITTNLKVSGSENIASNLVIGLIQPTLNLPISYASSSGALSNVGVIYCYKVTAYNPSGESMPSSEKCVTPSAGHNTVNITWTPVEFATGYKLYGRSNGVYGLIGTIADTKFIDFGVVVPGTQPNPSATLGNITATGAASFGGNVNISGDLSVSGSINSLSSTQQLVRNFVAENGENINAGDVVSFVNGKLLKGFDRGIGPKQYFGGGANYISVSNLSANTFVIAYYNYSYVNSAYTYTAYAVIGTVSGNTITYSTPVVVYSGSSGINAIKVAGLSANSFVAVYSYYDSVTSGYKTNAVIGTVSSSSVLFGSPILMTSNYPYTLSLIALSANTFIANYYYYDSTSTYNGVNNVGIVSGNTITWGSGGNFYLTINTKDGYLSNPAVTPLSSNTFLLGYVQYTPTSPNYYYTIYYRIATISNGAITYGTLYSLGPYSSINQLSLTTLSANTFAISYYSYYSSATPYSLRPYYQYSQSSNNLFIGSISNNAITLSSPIYDIASLYYILSLSTNRIGIIYYDNGKYSVKSAFINGNSMTFDSGYPISSISPGGVAMLSNNTFVIVNSDGSSNIANLSSTGPIIGVAKAFGSGGQSIPVIIGGISNVHSNLVPGSVYYANQTGNIVSSYTDNKIGIAISQTEILINNNKNSQDQFIG